MMSIRGIGSWLIDRVLVLKRSGCMPPSHSPLKGEKKERAGALV